MRRAHEFEHTRAVVYTLTSIYRDPKKKFPTVEEFWPLSTDNIDDRKKQDEEEGKRLYEKLQKFKRDKLYKK